MRNNYENIMRSLNRSYVRFFQVETATKYKTLFSLAILRRVLLINISKQNSVYSQEEGQHKCLSSSGPNLKLLIHNETSRSEVQ